jgi:hypothetical protein
MTQEITKLEESIANTTQEFGDLEHLSWLSGVRFMAENLSTEAEHLNKQLDEERKTS